MPTPDDEFMDDAKRILDESVHVSDDPGPDPEPENGAAEDADFPGQPLFGTPAALQGFLGALTQAAGNPPAEEAPSEAEQANRERLAKAMTHWMETPHDGTAQDALARAVHSAETADVIDSPSSGSFALTSLAWQGLVQLYRDTEGETVHVTDEAYGYARGAFLDATDRLQRYARLLSDARTALRSMVQEAERYGYVIPPAVAETYDALDTFVADGAIPVARPEAEARPGGAHLTRDDARARIVEVLNRPGATSMYLPAAGRAADQILEALSAPAVGATLFGQDVGDGLDQERQDAAAAMDILRLLLGTGLLSPVEGTDKATTLDSGVALVLRPAQAELLRSLREEGYSVGAIPEPQASRPDALQLLRLLLRSWEVTLDPSGGQQVLSIGHRAPIILSDAEAKAMRESWPDVATRPAPAEGERD